MQNSQVKHEAVERQAGQAQAMSEFGGQAGVVEAMAFVSGQPFRHLGQAPKKGEIGPEMPAFRVSDSVSELPFAGASPFCISFWLSPRRCCDMPTAEFV